MQRFEILFLALVTAAPALGPAPGTPQEEQGDRARIETGMRAVIQRLDGVGYARDVTEDESVRAPRS